jgi:hypothetical protein
VAKKLIANAVSVQMASKQRLYMPMAFYHCHALADCEDAMESFGIAGDDLPITVVHYTQTNRKYRMDVADLPFTVKSLGKFYADVLSGKRAPLPEEEEEEEEGGEL